jgi:hypothetical protein
VEQDVDFHGHGVYSTVLNQDRHPEVRSALFERSASKGDGPGRSSFEGRALCRARVNELQYRRAATSG